MPAPIYEACLRAPDLEFFLSQQPVSEYDFEFNYKFLWLGCGLSMLISEALNPGSMVARLPGKFPTIRKA